jgi:benzoate transport
MGMLQVLVVAITIGLTALDGFDVLSISFALPGIANEWHMPRTALGLVASMELWGMALGSLLLGGVADKIGRRPTLLGCLVAMVIGMFLVTTAHSPVQLSIWRLLTGLGIGGLLAATNAVTAEFASTRYRNLCISLMAIGYPVGAVVGGKIVAYLLGAHLNILGVNTDDWRSIFYFGATVTAVFLPLVYFLVPESVHWLVQKQPQGALPQVNHTLKRMGHAGTDTLPAVAPKERQRSIGDIFAPAFLTTTVLLAAAYFFHVVTFYFLVKWIPKLVVDMHFTAAQGADVLVWTNVGGALGGAVLGLLAVRYPVKPLTIGVMALSTVAVVIFGHTPPELGQLSLFAAISGFFTNAGIVGMYAIFAQAYPTHVRAFGTGFAIGIGRGGSALAPPLGGALFDAGFGLPIVATIMGLSALVAAVLVTLLKLKPEEKVSSGTPSLTGA